MKRWPRLGLAAAVACVLGGASSATASDVSTRLRRTPDDETGRVLTARPAARAMDGLRPAFFPHAFGVLEEHRSAVLGAHAALRSSRGSLLARTLARAATPAPRAGEAGRGTGGWDPAERGRFSERARRVPLDASAHLGADPKQAAPFGRLDREVIRGVIVAEMPRVEGCYLPVLETSPALAGRVIVSFTIAPDGHVAGATVRDTTLFPRAEPAFAVETCIVGIVLGFVFPAPEGGGPVQVNYPFVLAPAPPADAEGEER